MADIYRNFLAGTITDSPLLAAATTISSAAFANLPEVVAPNTMRLVLDPTSVGGAPEVTIVTAHATAATIVTATRGAESSMARQHAVSTIWRHSTTQATYDQLPHRLLTTTGDTLHASAANTAARLGIGTTSHVYQVVAGVPAWGQVVADGIASDAVTTVKILDSNVTLAKMADNSVGTVELVDKAVTGPKMLPAVCQVANAGFALAHNTTVLVPFTAAEVLDPLNWHDTSTNPERITPTIAGWYRVSTGALLTADTDYTRLRVQVLKNGVVAVSEDRPYTHSGGSIPVGATISTPLIQMNGSTDYLTVDVYQANSSAGGATAQTTFLVELVRPT